MVTVKAGVRSDELTPAPDESKSCLIIGAGVAGLQVLRHLCGLGGRVLVLEANSDVGGVWKENYVGYSLQVPWRMYQFPDFLWPKDLQPTDEYPTGEQVHKYIRAYAQHFGLMRHIRLNCKLLRLRWKQSERTWEALYSDTTREGLFKVSADFVVMSSGMYCNPYVPPYKNADSFAGLRLHAKEFTDVSVARGRRVVIVGAGKTALDCVSGLLASRCAASVTLLYRRAHWPVPRRVAGVPVRLLLFSRAAAAMLPPYYTASRVQRAMHWVAKPLKKLFWRGVQGAIAATFKATNRLRPSVDLPADLFYGGQILDDSMDELLEEGQAEALKGEIDSFVSNGVILQDGSFQPADLVLYCTGYEKSYTCFDSATRTLLGLQKDGLYLYRNCLPCAVPHLAFVGSEVSTFNNILTHSLQALWLAHVIRGAVQLPAREAMAADVRAQQRWRREVMPVQRSRGAALMMYGMQYHDQLLSDMGHNPRRKGLNPLAECFGTYSAKDYTGLTRRDTEVNDATRPAAARLSGDQWSPPSLVSSPTPSMAPTPAPTAALTAMATTAAVATPTATVAAMTVTAGTGTATTAGRYDASLRQTMYDMLDMDETWLTTADWPYVEPPLDLNPSCGGNATAAATAAAGVKVDRSVTGAATVFVTAGFRMPITSSDAAGGGGGHGSDGAGRAAGHSRSFGMSSAPSPLSRLYSGLYASAQTVAPTPPHALMQFSGPQPPAEKGEEEEEEEALEHSWHSMSQIGSVARAISVSAFATATATARPLRTASTSASYHLRSPFLSTSRRPVTSATSASTPGGAPMRSSSITRRSSGGTSRLSRVVFGPAVADAAERYGQVGGGKGAGVSSCEAGGGPGGDGGDGGGGGGGDPSDRRPTT